MEQFSVSEQIALSVFKKGLYLGFVIDVTVSSAVG